MVKRHNTKPHEMPFSHEKPESNIIKRYVLYTCIKNLEPNIDPYRYQDYTLVCRLRRTMMIIIIFTDYFHFRVFTLSFFLVTFSLRWDFWTFFSKACDLIAIVATEYNCTQSPAQKSHLYTQTHVKERETFALFLAFCHMLLLYTCSPNSSIFSLGWMSEIANVSANSIQY